jgi:hypothetical protein
MEELAKRAGKIPPWNPRTYFKNEIFPSLQFRT